VGFSGENKRMAEKPKSGGAAVAAVDDMMKPERRSTTTMDGRLISHKELESTCPRPMRPARCELVSASELKLGSAALTTAKERDGAHMVRTPAARRGHMTSGVFCSRVTSRFGRPGSRCRSRLMYAGPDRGVLAFGGGQRVHRFEPPGLLGHGTFAAACSARDSLIVGTPTR